MPTLFERSAPAKQMPPKKIGKRPPLSHISPLTAYALRPENVKFETQEETEEVILFLRQHSILLIPWMVLGAILCIAPTIVFPFVGKYLITPIPIPLGYVITGTAFWYVATFGFILMKFLRWYFNIFIVTNERIIDIDFVNFLYKEFSEAQLSRVQDISYQIRGILATFVNFGDVLIQTAGEVPNFVFESVPKPDSVVEVVSELAEHAKNNSL